ncbi:tripartite tricarboxylate transporter TctB family protein [Pseudooceanicola sp. CBS1P-1]|uniref:Tripartite tricarboxylate transporter TctB family protein n=1 Tax=Pseudooceanicola albus TaxID=2692189 RepID=A0A6L7G612_9RHOB|nr:MULTISPECIES: tripartite tricarboxylate transporter TctB family protein [Pseudooceanicola]MBT9385673.1 tripartite tricarboxylate transporter TctB family protein [Pseudooceanicola endophyticus]MXN18918.1 tripartite tricarboxylate transporter TctB family protein [Pseudooceanicola albus]
MTESEHHHDSSRDGSSDATPGGAAGKRRPGELVFTIILVIFSAVLLWNAYGIAGFEALSSPGAIPMGTAAVMLISAAMVLNQTLRKPRAEDETMLQDIVPPLVIVLALFLVAYGVLLEPLGFLPTSLLFLLASIKILSKRSWGFTITVSVGSLLGIYLVFRIVFTVLMPTGIIPEAEILQAIRNLFAGGA